MIYRCISSPRETCSKVINFLYWFGRHHIKGDKSLNFVINHRVTEHTIYPDGTLIILTKYSITMLAKGDFYLPRYYKSDNDELNKDGSRKVDMSLYPDEIYTNLNQNVRENRFNEHLIVVSLHGDENKQKHRFVPRIISRTSERVDYSVTYTKLRMFQTFEFFVCITVPREFDRASAVDKVNIEPVYGVFEFHSKIDKQRKNSDKYIPVLTHGAEVVESKAIDNFFYVGDFWKLYNPEKSVLEAK